MKYQVSAAACLALLGFAHSVAGTDASEISNSASCGSCNNCYYAGNNICHDNWTASDCAKVPEYQWCGATLAPTTTATPTITPTPAPTRPAECGKCNNCFYAKGGNLCWDNWTKGDCLANPANGFVWCGPVPTPAPTPTPARTRPAECGKCNNCFYKAGGNLCWSNWTEKSCLANPDNGFVWCGPVPTPAPTPAPTRPAECGKCNNCFYAKGGNLCWDNWTKGDCLANPANKYVWCGLD